MSRVMQIKIALLQTSLARGKQMRKVVFKVPGSWFSSPIDNLIPTMEL